MRTFLIPITKEDEFFVTRCPTIGVTSQGETLGEAQANVEEVIDRYIESFV